MKIKVARQKQMHEHSRIGAILKNAMLQQ